VAATPVQIWALSLTLKNPFCINLTDFNAKKGCTSRPMKALFLFIRKPIKKHRIKVLFRNPDIFGEELVGNDIDMVYIANQYDIKKALKKLGLELKS